MALVDAIKLNSVLISNGGFETPILASGQYVFNPTNATPWTFTATTGITRNNSIYTGTVTAPEGHQAAMVQNTGNLSQTMTLTAGSYILKLSSSQAKGNATSQTFNVTLQNVPAIQVNSTKQFVWIGNRIAEERDGNNNIVRRLYPQGEQISGASYYYTRDQLGSIRELVDSTNAIRARYDYDPYGYSFKLSGDLDSEFGYAGLYFHQPSGLNLAVYRAYQPTMGRWLSRDPIAEPGGLNLYDYADNNPLNLSDRSGLCPGDFWDLLTQFLLGAEEGAYAAIDAAIPFADPFADRYDPNDPGIWFSQDVGGPALQTLALAGVGEVVNLLRAPEVAASTYANITEGSSVVNRATNVTTSAFESNLIEGGFTRTVSQDGAATILQKDGATYVLRSSPTSGPTADFYTAGSKAIQLKIRLGR